MLTKLKMNIDNSLVDLRKFEVGDLSQVTDKKFTLSNEWTYTEIPISQVHAEEVINWRMEEGKHRVLINGDILCISKAETYSYFILKLAQNYYRITLRHKSEK